MATSLIIMVAFFAVAMVLIYIALAWAYLSGRKQHRHDDAEKLRGNPREKLLLARLRESLAEVTAAKARAAQAGADVKAAQASRLGPQATAHRSDAATSADRMHPATPTSETARPADSR